MTRPTGFPRRRRLLAALAAVALLGACGGKTQPDTIPTLPGDGTDNVAQPGPEGTPAGDARPDPWAGAELIEEPAARPPVEVKLPAVQRFTLSNGLEVIVVENADLPVVGMVLAVKAGDADDPRDRVGLATFTASMLDKGTRKYAADKIADRIDFVGGNLGATAHLEATTASCAVLAKDLATCLELLPEVAIRPTFPENEMKTVRDQLMSSVRQRKDEAGALATAHIANALWGGEHVRGWPLSAATINAITRADLVKFHQTWFRPNNALLAVAGDVNAKQLKQELERRFRGWKRGDVPEHARHEVPEVEGIRVRLVDKPGQTQAHIRVAHVGVSRKDPDYLATQVMNYSLGGGAFSSRLMQVVRSEEGKAYGAGSGFQADVMRGAFVAATFTRTSETVATVKLLLQEIGKMHAEGPTEKEITDARTNITGSYGIGFQSAADVAGALLEAELRGETEEDVRTRALQVGAVTLEQARKAARDRLDPKNLVIVIVGEAANIEPQLEGTGWQIEKVSFDEPIAAWERAALAAAASREVDPAQEKAARKVLAAAIAAKGGDKKLRGIKSIATKGKAKVSQGAQSFDAKFERKIVFPDRMRLDIDIQVPQGHVIITNAFAKDAGWARQELVGQGAQVKDWGPAELADGRRVTWRHPEVVLLHHADEGVTVKPLPGATVDGKPHDVVALIDPGGTTVTLYLDAQTKLLSRMTYQEGGVEATETFGDYKKVNGVQIAHRRVTRGDDADFDVTVESVELNPTIDPATFAKPEK